MTCMREIEITLHLPEELVKEAMHLGLLSSDYVAMLLRADIQAQLAAMANDPEIQREIEQIDAEFRAAEDETIS